MHYFVYLINFRKSGFDFNMNKHNLANLFIN